MGRRISVGEYHVDDISKQMLAALSARRDAEDPSMQTGELLEECDLERHYKITNRVDTHLGPARLVEDISDEDDPYAFVLTDGGAAFVEEHGLDAPTLDEVREMARDAEEEADEARRSVNRYRKEVHEIRKEAPTLNSLQNEFGEFREIIYRDEDKPSDTWMLQNESRIETTQQNVGELQNQFESLQQELQSVNNRLDNMDSSIEDLERNLSSFEDDVDRADENARKAIAKVNDFLIQQSKAAQRRPSQPAEPEEQTDEEIDILDYDGSSGRESRLPSIPLPSWRQVVWVVVLVGLIVLIVFVWWPAAQQTLAPFF